MVQGHAALSRVRGLQPYHASVFFGLRLGCAPLNRCQCDRRGYAGCMDVDAALAELEAAIKRRGKWRGRWVFYQVLEGELAPILAAALDPAAVRARVNAALLRHGHSLEAPPKPSPTTDAAPLCRPSPYASEA